MDRRLPSIALLATSLLSIVAPCRAASPPEDTGGLQQLDEAVVVGRFPGPPLWKVSSGDHALWILPIVDMYPKQMEWESTRVQELVAGASEYLYRPLVRSGVSTKNPLAMIRMLTLQGEIDRLPNGQTLADVLPAEVYRRFSVLKARYFPRDGKIERMSISLAARTMEAHILAHEKLERLSDQRNDSPLLITSKIRKWLGRNKSLRRTVIRHGTVSAASLKDLGTLNDLVREVNGSPAFRQWEVGCLAQAIAYFEDDLAPVKRRANAWAQGDASDLVSPVPLYDRSDSCRNIPLDLVLGSSVAIGKLRKDNPTLATAITERRVDMEAASRAKWLVAAEAALARNDSTFALLTINDVLDEQGLVAQLRAKGYTVEVSAR